VGPVLTGGDRHTRNHFSEFDELKINRVSIAMIEKWIADRQAEEMPIATIRKILVSMGQIFKYAARHKYLSYNPFSDAERPSGKGKKDTIEVLTPEKINALLDSVTDQKYKMLFKLAIMSGARQGGLFGLKWSGIDWENSQVHIQRTFNNQEWYEVKTKTSNRKIDLGPAMLADLKKWKLACPPNDLDLIFPNEAGQPLNHNNVVSSYFNPAIENAGIKQIRFHDMRHTSASLLIEQGENIKYIQSQLGHSSPTVTWNVYAHLMKEVNQKAACKLENTVFKPTGHQMVTES
jgi:integrase